jgi:nitrate/TMAO reductase-like tetraheme cytochrome c subunit
MSGDKPDGPVDGGDTAAPPKRWWRWLGLRRREGRWLRVVPTRWGWVFLALIGVVVGSLGFAEYSMQPDFCRSCHIMEPYYQAWHTSTHKDVACVMCHFEPGLENTLKGKWQASSQAAKYITNTYGSKPHAEVRDSSCMREGCHEKRLLQGRVDWPIKTQRGTTITIKFDHTPHLTELRRGKQLRCVSCHSQIVQGQHLVVTLDTCFLCHFKGLKHGRDDETLGGCRSCHDAPKAEIQLATGVFKHSDYIDRGVACENCHVDAVSGDGAVPKQLCWTCHNQPAQIARYGETSFMHQSHVTDNKVDCASCHVQIVHHLTAGLASSGGLLPSLDGHTGDDKSTCAQCHDLSHNGPAELYSGTGGRGVPDMPSPMFSAQVDCVACHKQREFSREVAEVTGQTYIAAQASCDECHGSHYGGVLDEWRDTISEHLASAQRLQQEAEDSLAAAAVPPDQELELQRLLDDADHNVRLVKLGRGVHNVTYATALLNVAIENYNRVKDALKTVPRIDVAVSEAQP